VSIFVYKLIPPRPSFAVDMTEHEAKVMAEHAAYWHQELRTGRIVAFGPVADPGGVWGLGLIDVASSDEALALVERDPAITSRLGTYELHPMDAVVRDSSS
jgi:uncharacterized protein